MNRLRALLAHLRLRPFDTNTPEGRAQERYRRAALTAVASLGARGVRVATSLLSVPMTISYLGSERYGMWLTITSLSAVLIVANLGVGNGLTNLIADANARGDRDGARRDLTTALAAMLTTCGGAFLVAMLVYPVVPWAAVYNVTDAAAAREAGPASMAFIGCWLSSFVLGLVNAVNRGHQDGFVDSLMEMVGSVTGLVALVLLMQAHVGLPWLVLALVGSTSVAHLLNWAVLLWRRPYLRPSFGAFERSRLNGILGLGSAYLLVFIAFEIANGSRNFVVAHTLGAPLVPELDVPLRGFATLNMLFGVLVNPLWPAFTDALARRDVPWIRSALARVVRLTAGVGLLVSIPLVAVGPFVIHLWVGDAVTPTYPRLALIALWFNLAGVSNALGVFLQATHRVWQRAAADLAGALVGVALMVVFAGRLGIEGVLLGMLVSEGVCRLVPMVWTTRAVVRGLGEEQRKSAAELTGAG